MELEEFAQHLLQDVLTKAEADGELQQDVFFQVSCEQLIAEAGELETADRVFYEAPTRGIRIDGYGGDPLDSDNVLGLIILDFHVSQKLERLSSTEMDTLFRRLSNYLRYALNVKWRNALEETSPAFGLSDLIAQRWESVIKVRLFLVSNRILSERVDGRPAGVIEGKQITYSVWDIRRLHAFSNASSNREDMVVDLENDFGGPLSVLPAQQTHNQHKSYLAVVPGKVLASIYNRWGARILEQNVRVFLQARGKVNRGIRKTLENEPSMFFAYNNGITATAEAVDISYKGGQMLLRCLKNFQIVNGGQTTASIYRAWLSTMDISNTFVQMKLSVVSPEHATTIVPKISEYANSQNRVSSADFFANHPFHIRMEKFSRRIYAPSPDGSFRDSKWFYERARGQYADARSNLTPAQRKKFDLENPRKQLFTKTDLAKFINVCEGLPHEVSLGAQKNFAIFAKSVGQTWSKSQNAFNEGWYKQAVAKAILFRITERIVSVQSWYQGGYRANIVAYTIAKIVFEVKKQNCMVNFNAIWLNQDVGLAMKETIASVAKRVHDVLINPPKGISNVTEWAKKPACWGRVERLSVDFPPNLSEELISVREHKEAQQGEGKRQKQLNGIEAQIKVVDADCEFWVDTIKWGHAREILLPKEVEILERLSRKPKYVPTEKECLKVIEVLSKLQEEGYSGKL